MFTVFKHALCGCDRPELQTPLFGIFREDNNFYLGSCHEHWEIIQNEEIWAKINEICGDQGYEIYRSGEWGGGKKCWVQITVNGAEEVGTDRVTRVLTVFWGHTGKDGISVATTFNVMSCLNKFYWFKEKGFKIRHSKNGRDRLEKLPDAIADAVNNPELFEDFKILHSCEIDIFQVRNLIQHLTWDKKKYPKGIDITDPVFMANLPPRTRNRVNVLADAIKSELDAKGWTYWGLFNGVTYYHNHIVKSKSKEKYLTEGKGGKDALKALTWCKKQCNV